MLLSWPHEQRCPRSPLHQGGLRWGCGFEAWAQRKLGVEEILPRDGRGEARSRVVSWLPMNGSLEEGRDTTSYQLCDCGQLT